MWNSDIDITNGLCAKHVLRSRANRCIQSGRTNFASCPRKSWWIFTKAVILCSILSPVSFEFRDKSRESESRFIASTWGRLQCLSSIAVHAARLISIITTNNVLESRAFVSDTNMAHFVGSWLSNFHGVLHRNDCIPQKLEHHLLFCLESLLHLESLVTQISIHLSGWLHAFRADTARGDCNVIVLAPVQYSSAVPVILTNGNELISVTRSSEIETAHRFLRIIFSNIMWSNCTSHVRR